MARRAEGWKLYQKRGFWYVSFTHQGHRYRLATGTREAEEARARAAQLYADVVAGRIRVAASGVITNPGQSLAELVALWIEAIAHELGQGTDMTYEVYGRHWRAHFSVLGGLTDAACANYVRKRLGQVQAETVRKERGALGRFLSWLVEQGYLAHAPILPSIPKKALGTKRDKGIRAQAADITAEQVEAILGRLPKLSRGLPCRSYFRFLYETALRPEGTVDRLEWRDVTPFGLHIRAACDKNRYERTVPISLKARAALDEVRALSKSTHPRTKIFGTHDLSVSFEKACREVFGGSPPDGLTRYALKHARITYWYDQGATGPGLKLLTGDRMDTLDKHYMRPSRRAAEELVGGTIVSPDKNPECEGEDLNLHGNYPASTSSSGESVNAGESCVSSRSESSAIVGTRSLSVTRCQNLPGVVRVALWQRAS